MVIFSGKYKKFFLWVKSWFLQTGVKKFLVRKIVFFWVNIRSFLGRNFLFQLIRWVGRVNPLSTAHMLQNPFTFPFSWSWLHKSVFSCIKCGAVLKQTNQRAARAMWKISVQACHYLIRQQNQRMWMLLWYSMQVHYPIVACYFHTAAFLIVDDHAFCAVKRILKFEFSHFEHSDRI